MDLLSFPFLWVCSVCFVGGRMVGWGEGGRLLVGLFSLLLSGKIPFALQDIFVFSQKAACLSTVWWRKRGVIVVLTWCSAMHTNNKCSKAIFPERLRVTQQLIAMKVSVCQWQHKSLGVGTAPVWVTGRKFASLYCQRPLPSHFSLGVLFFVRHESSSVESLINTLKKKKA